MEMAGLADKVVSDPNKHIGKMHQLHLLVADEDKTVVCLAILTQAEVGQLLSLSLSLSLSLLRPFMPRSSANASRLVTRISFLFFMIRF